jgi:hypothetical protein
MDICPIFVFNSNLDDNIFFSYVSPPEYGQESDIICIFDGGTT